MHDHGEKCDCGSFSSSLPDEQSLLPYIDTEGLDALNAKDSRNVKSLFRPFSERHHDAPIVEAEEDEDLELTYMGSRQFVQRLQIIRIPFVAPCRLTGLRIIGVDRASTPKEVRIFANNENYDFSTADAASPVQTIDLAPDSFCGTADYPLKTAKLLNVHHLTLHFRDSFEQKFLKLSWLDVRGVCTNVKRKPVVTVYEARANLSDHAISDKITNHSIL